VYAFNKLTEKEVFAYLINWILNNMHSSEKATLRYKINGHTYQFKFSYQARHLRVTKPKVISDNVNFISYIWTKEDVYNQLNVQKIMESIQRADTENVNHEQGNPDNPTDEAGTKTHKS